MARLWHALMLALPLAVGADARAFAQARPPAPSLPPDPAAVLLPPVASDRVSLRPSVQLSDTALPQPTHEPAARLVFDPAEYETIRPVEYDTARRAAGPAPAREQAEDGLAYLTEGFYKKGFDGKAVKRGSDYPNDTPKNEGGVTGWMKRTFGNSEAKGHGVDDAIDGKGARQAFQSDAAFCDWVSPLSNPFYAEDPRSLTELRGVALYQRLPSSDPFFRGGNGLFFGGQGRLAFTERISLVVHKVGVTSLNPGGRSLFAGGTTLSELWLGPKVVVYRDAETKTLISLGTQFQIPLGGTQAFQDTGSLSIVPYVSAGQRLLPTEIGTLNGQATAGYSFATNRDRSDFFFASAHLDFDIANGHRFYPVAELNWFSYTKDGRQRPISTEGRDFANVGAAAKGANLVTWSLGLRWKSQDKRWEIGGGYEGHLLGQRGLFDGRFGLDVIWRF